ncbi:hypothetical protein [Paenibacillus sp. 7516]|uniref:hypothetical protein n=1 Tax=Paenibacillus sp. 7516 TaxID=2022549 RepID=UPI000BA5A7D2|nr:hypothetical protein [Paenibacillus sp. 7516]PAF32095.1 hypothetical protein CHI14_10705 [Paenibacillus sp. 7516]
MRKQTIFWITGIAIVVVVVLFTYNNLVPSLKERDVSMKGTIRQIDTDEYEVDIQITRTEEDNDIHMVYPVLFGWGNLSFSEELDDSYFRPSSVGISGELEQFVHQALQDEGINTSNENGIFAGFSIPDEAGTYRVRFTISPLSENVHSLNDPKIYYVHQEKVLGKTLNWVKKGHMVMIKENVE